MARRPHKGGLSRAVFKKPREDAAALLQGASVVNNTFDPSALHSGDAVSGDVSGSLPGPLTVSKYAGPPRYYVERALPTTVNNYIELGYVISASGVNSPAFDVGIAVGAGSFVSVKRFLVPGYYGTGFGPVATGTWHKVVPIGNSFSGANDYELEANYDSTTMRCYLRLRRSLGTNLGDAKVTITLWGEDGDTFVAQTGTGSTTAPTVRLPDTVIEQIGGALRIYATDPAGYCDLVVSGGLLGLGALPAFSNSWIGTNWITGGNTVLVGFDGDIVNNGGAISVLDSTGTIWKTMVKRESDSQVGTGSGIKHAAYGYDARSQKITGLAAGVAATDAARISQVPTAGQLAALVGTNGTPGASNPYATDSDPRLNISEIALDDAALSLDLQSFVTLGSGGSGLNDLTGNAHNASGNGGVTIGSGPSLNSESEGSTDLDGVDDFISFAHAPWVAGGAFSVFFSIKFDVMNTGGFYPLIASSSATGPALKVQKLVSNVAEFNFTSQTGLGISTSVQVPMERLGVNAFPLFIGLWFDDAADQFEIILNGASLGGVQAMTAAVGGAPGNLQIGSGASVVAPLALLNAKISHVGYVNRKLTLETFRWLTRIAIGGQRDWGLVTVLPTSSAIPGDRCTYVVDSANGIYWDLIYDAAGSFPWKYVGGPPIQAYSNASVTTTSTTYATPTSGQLTLTLPRAGDYDIQIEGQVQNSAANTTRLSYAVGALAASDDWAAFDASAGGTTKNSTKIGPEYRHLNRAASDIIAEKVNVTAGTGTYAKRKLYARPVRIA